MARRLVVLFVLGALAVAGIGMLYKNAYPFVLASEEARTALTVTEELTQELKAATYASDLIAFGIIGSVISAIIALSCSSRSTKTRKVVGTVAGAVIGFAAGCAGAAAGHWYTENVQWQLDPLVQWTLRWVLILFPIALASAVATALAGDFRRDLVNALAGAIVGSVASAAAFAVLHGLITPSENFSMVLPAFSANRFLIIASAIFGIGLGILWQVKTPKSAAPEPAV